MPRKKATSDPSNLIVPRGSILSIVLFKGHFECRDKAQAKRALMHALTLGVSMDMTKGIKGEWRVFLSMRGVNDLRAKHGWKNPAMDDANKIGRKRQPKAKDERRHPNRKVRVETVKVDLANFL